MLNNLPSLKKKKKGWVHFIIQYFLPHFDIFSQMSANVWQKTWQPKTQARCWMNKRTKCAKQTYWQPEFVRLSLTNASWRSVEWIPPPRPLDWIIDTSHLIFFPQELFPENLTEMSIKGPVLQETKTLLDLSFNGVCSGLRFILHPGLKGWQHWRSGWEWEEMSRLFTAGRIKDRWAGGCETGGKVLWTGRECGQC